MDEKKVSRLHYKIRPNCILSILTTYKEWSFPFYNLFYPILVNRNSECDNKQISFSNDKVLGILYNDCLKTNLNI